MRVQAQDVLSPCTELQGHLQLKRLLQQDGSMQLEGRG